MSEEERLVADIPSELKQLIDADSRTNKQVVISALWDEFGGQRASDIEREKREKEDRRTYLQEQVDERLGEIEELDQQIQALERKANRMQEDKSDLWDAAENAVTVVDGEIIEGEQYLAHHASNLNLSVEELRSELIQRCNDE